MVVIYSIRCVENGRAYVGSTDNVARRWSAHRNLLARGAHDNSHLQRAYNRYGEASFIYEELETCEPQKRIERETFWLRSLRAKQRGFNQRLPGSNEKSGYNRKVEAAQIVECFQRAASGTSLSEIASSYDVSDATVRRILERKTYCSVEIDPSLVERAQRLAFPGSGSNNARRKLSDDDVRTIRRRAERGETYTAIAADYPVTRRIIGLVVRREHYATVD